MLWYILRWSAELICIGASGKIPCTWPPILSLTCWSAVIGIAGAKLVAIFWSKSFIWSNTIFCSAQTGSDGLIGVGAYLDIWYITELYGDNACGTPNVGVLNSVVILDISLSFVAKKDCGAWYWKKKSPSAFNLDITPRQFNPLPLLADMLKSVSIISLIT